MRSWPCVAISVMSAISPQCVSVAFVSRLSGAASSGSLAPGDQKFDIALGPGDRAFDEVGHVPALAGQPASHFGADAFVDRGVAHDALLADLVPFGLELRLDQRDDARARFRSAEHTSELQS